MARLETLLDAETLAARIRELGAEIRAAYGDTEITCVGILKGSIVFLGDLVRTIDGELSIDFLGVTSYHGTQTTGSVRITHDLHADIAGKHVLLIEDIVDTGLTLSYILRSLQARKPASLKVATLLDKPSRRRVEVPVDFVGFTIPDRFVVGFGLDLDQRYRNVPYVAVYHPEG